VTYDISDWVRWANRMKPSLGEIIHHEQDQVVFIDLGPTEGREVKEIEAIGCPMDVIGREPMVV
jgi:hypothetical protein